jgi:hypothetical protein
MAAQASSGRAPESIVARDDTASPQDQVIAIYDAQVFTDVSSPPRGTAIAAKERFKTCFRPG